MRRTSVISATTTRRTTGLSTARIFTSATSEFCSESYFPHRRDVKMNILDFHSLGQITWFSVVFDVCASSLA
uniref:Uncharacterized protein n=1 Tax=Physcomitrium patens TaxID=3218 RepID=A0A2K1KJJ5_PHYPA|nr:hypothetical protein PHYPA_007623 [Physcomitrium patens]